LTREQVSTLNGLSTGAPESVTEVNVDSGAYSRDLPLRANDVYLIVLTPIK
jgi:xylan 1,4-beta-xylosidase